MNCLCEPGRLYGVGVGPGDPKLLTVRAVEIITSVPVIFAAGSPKNNYSLALETVRPYLKSETEVRTLSFPMTYHRGNLEKAWSENARAVLAVLASGRAAAFLTIGDSLTYSTYGYLIQTILNLAPETKIETVPGITAYHAAAARINQPLVEGRESLVIVSGVDDPERIKELTDQADNLVIMKAYRSFTQICDAVVQCRPDARVVAVVRLGLPDERIVLDARTLRGEDLPYLTLLIVKKKSETSG